jgi:hypothetical protein
MRISPKFSFQRPVRVDLIQTRIVDDIDGQSYCGQF